MINGPLAQKSAAGPRWRQLWGVVRAKGPRSRRRSALEGFSDTRRAGGRANPKIPVRAGVDVHHVTPPLLADRDILPMAQFTSQKKPEFRSSNGMPLRRAKPATNFIAASAGIWARRAVADRGKTRIAAVIRGVADPLAKVCNRPDPTAGSARIQQSIPRPARPAERRHILQPITIKTRTANLAAA